MSTQAKDLTKEAPASPKHRVGGYVILARLADKARASFMGGELGDFHTDCPLDHMLLDWKGVKYDDVKQAIVNGADDEELAGVIDKLGTPKTREEIAEWSDATEKKSMYNDPNPQKKEYFIGETQKLGLDPATATTFDWLDADDKASFGK